MTTRGCSRLPPSGKLSRRIAHGARLQAQDREGLVAARGQPAEPLRTAGRVSGFGCCGRRSTPKRWNCSKRARQRLRRARNGGHRLA
jgi:hypothetical protein